MGICGQVNVFVANFKDRPAGLDPNAAQFFAPSFTYRAPVDERNASSVVPGQHAVRFARQREALHWKPGAGVREHGRRQLLPHVAGLQHGFGGRQLRSDVQKYDW